MTKLISQNENGVIYVENNEGEVFGIVDIMNITDGDGILYNKPTIDVLENAGFEIIEDSSKYGVSFIEFIEQNGEVSRIEFNYGVELL